MNLLTFFYFFFFYKWIYLHKLNYIYRIWAKKIITIIIFISGDIDNYHDKCQIFISFKFKDRFLLQSESCRNQTINFH